MELLWIVAAVFGIAFLSGEAEAVKVAQVLGNGNNNPFNIKASDGNDWQGQIGVDSRGFCIFARLEDGLRAGFIVVLKKFTTHGATNLWDFGQMFAPAADNPPAAIGDYGKGIAAQLGISPLSDYNPLNLDTLVQLGNAVIVNEEGADPATADQLRTAAQEALNYVNT